MRDDINTLAIPASAKKYARRKGLKSMLNQPKDYIRVVSDITNQNFKGFPNRDKGQKVRTSFVEGLVNALF